MAEASPKKQKTAAVRNNLEYLIVRASDVAKTVEFYTTLFGFTKAFSMEGWTELKLKSSRPCSTLAVQPAASKEAGKKTVALSFCVDKLDEFHAKATANNVTVRMPPKAQPWGSMAVYAGPDGEEVSVAEMPPGGEPCGVNLECGVVYAKENTSAKQTAALYEQVYGFHEPKHFSDDWIELRLDNGGRAHSTLGCHKHEPTSSSAGGVRGGVGQVQLGFFVLSLEDFHAAAVKHGLTVVQPPAKQPWGGFKAEYEDVNGVMHSSRTHPARYESRPCFSHEMPCSVVECDWTTWKPEEASKKVDVKLTGHMEIPVRDMDRAKKFFGDVFGFTFRQFIPSYALFTAPKAEEMKGTELGGGLDLVDSDDLLLKYHVLCFSTNDIEAALEKVVAAGGKVLKPKWQIDESVGWQAVWQDTEGNAHSFYKSAKDMK